MFSKPAESLRLQLLRWLLLPLLIVLSINAWFSNRAAVAVANMAFDRLLMASAEAIAEDVEVKDGEIAVDLPYAALELLESNIQERIFYRVVAPSGKTVTGYDDLPLPRADETPQLDSTLYAARYRGEAIHLVALNKRLYGAGPQAPVIVIVAETGEARDALSHQILTEGLTRQSVLILASGLLVWLGLVRGLRPLNRLRSSITQRAPSDLSPIDPAEVQTEVRPLIEALNQHTARIERLLSGRQRFISDASHQMRTPLSEMRTQIEYSLRQNQPELSHRTLIDVHADVERLARLLSQLLLQARSDPDGLPGVRRDRVDLGDLARETSLEQVGAARRKAIDLSFEPAPKPAIVLGNGLLLRELIANLIDNAITHGRDGGSVAVRLLLAEGWVTLEVEDDGPGIPDAERDQVFERFHRLAGTTAPGSGLGLSIVRDIGLSHGARIDLRTPASGRGLCVRVALPAARAEADARPTTPI